MSEQHTDPPVTGADDEHFDQAIDDVGRRAGAALRRPAPDRTLDDIVRRGEQQQRRRTTLGVVGASVAVIAVVAIAVWAAEDDRDAPVITTPSTAATTTTLPPGSVSLDTVAQAALLTAEDLGEGWVQAPEPPPFFLEPAYAADIESCDEFQTSLFDRFSEATITTRRFTRGEAWINEHVVVFPQAADADIVWSELNGSTSGAQHAQCFAALRDAGLSPVALELFGVLVEPGLAGRGAFDYTAMPDGELRTLNDSAAANLLREHVLYVVETSGVAAPSTIASDAGARVQLALDLGQPVDPVAPTTTLAAPAVEPALTGGADTDRGFPQWSTDGQRLIVSDSDKTVVLDAATLEPIVAFAHTATGPVTLDREATLAFDGTDVVEVDTARIVSSPAIADPWMASQFDPSSTLLLAQDGSGGVRAFDVANGDLVYEVPAIAVEESSSAFVDDNGFLIVSVDDRVRAFDASSGAPVFDVTVTDGLASVVGVDAEATTVSATTEDSCIAIDTATGDVVDTVTLPSDLAPAPTHAMWWEGCRGAWVTYDTYGAVVGWVDLATGRESLHVESSRGTAFTPTGDVVAIVHDGYAVVYRLATGEALATLAVPAGVSMSFSRDDRLAVIGPDGAISIWDLDDVI